MTTIINTKKLIELYKEGYFPMAENANTEEINFYKPKKRFIIPINSFHIPKKLFSNFIKTKYKFQINTSFVKVIENCAKKNKNRNETWINKIIKDTYIKLNKEGLAKSIECFDQNKLVGGLYGLHIGKCFFGESMFSTKDNTSKFCLLFLISILKEKKFILLDSQFFNKHLVQFGAFEISDSDYNLILKSGIKKKAEFPNNYNFLKSISILQSLSHKS